MTDPVTRPAAALSADNRLRDETSPYLLQHAGNPVAWRAWNPDALAEAKSANKPILLSVGYAACHWCHVMAHESFEDAATAAVMNELFVNIKVDREERPDIDQIYMSALHHLGEQGGWPLTMFLTPDAEPFWGGTYFPNVSKFGRPAFTDVLREVARLFRHEPQKIKQNRDALMMRLAEKARPPGKVTIGTDELNKIATQLAGAFDPVDGGLRGAPKFPNAALYELIWRAGVRMGDARFFTLIDHTMARICEGGIYDHLGGGFSRYSVDARWLVPHFEKMLYDNAQLLELLALTSRKTGKPLFRQRAQETVGWLAREMTTPEGLFCASLDADSEGEEGKFYVWSKAAVIDALGPDDGAFFSAHYDVTDGGNFEGHNILNRLIEMPRNAANEARLAPLREKLLALREHRIRPGLDDKALADWSGQMIAALVHAGTMLDEPGWIAMARRAFDAVVAHMSDGEARLGHSYRDGRLLKPGLASDYAMMIRAALALFEASGEGTYLQRAKDWQATLDAHYSNRHTGGYYLTADDAPGLVVRPASTADEAVPNPNAIAAQNLVRLAALTGDYAYREKADALIEGVLAGAADNLFAHAALLNALDMRLNLAEIVVTGERLEALAQAALRLPYTERVLLRAPSADALPQDHPAQAKIASGSGGAFVCQGERCSLPVADPDALARALEAAQGTLAA